MRGRPIFILTLHVRKTGKDKTEEGKQRNVVREVPQRAPHGRTAEQHRKAGAKTAPQGRARDGLRGKGIGYSQRFDYFCSI